MKDPEQASLSLMCAFFLSEIVSSLSNWVEQLHQQQTILEVLWNIIREDHGSQFARGRRGSFMLPDACISFLHSNSSVMIYIQQKLIDLVSRMPQGEPWKASLGINYYHSLASLVSKAH